MSFTIEREVKVPAVEIQATMPNPQIPYMVNPFEEEGELSSEVESEELGGTEESEELKKYLVWTHTPANPFDPDFLLELDGMVQGLKATIATPNLLAEGRGILGELTILAEMIETERKRLIDLYTEYEAHQKRIVSRYSEEQAAGWLRANMPQAYARAVRTSFGSEKAQAAIDKTKVNKIEAA